MVLCQSRTGGHTDVISEHIFQHLKPEYLPEEGPITNNAKHNAPALLLVLVVLRVLL